ncbi:MAG: DUF2959 family protein [Solirubrobacterales bacterium]
MTGKTLLKWIEVGVFCSVVALLTGCEMNEGRQAKVAKRAENSLADTRSQLLRAEQQVDTTLTSMDRLAAEPHNLKRSYKAYAGEVSKTVRESEQAQERADHMKTQWHEYMANWEKEANRLNSEQLRAGTTERRQTVREDYDHLRDVANNTHAAYEPFLTQLREIQRAISLDLTPAGVDATKPAMETARQTGAQLKEQINAFIQELDRVANAGVTQPTGTGTVAGSQP